MSSSRVGLVERDEEPGRPLPPGEDGGAGAPRSRRLVRAAVAGGLVLALALLVLAFVVASKAAYGGNSDDATLVLQGESMAHGNLALSGWDLSYDAFWTSEVPLYVLAVRLAGVQPGLMYVVPAVVGVLVVVAAACLALAGSAPLTAAVAPARRRQARIAAGGVIVALLALPNPVLSYFLLQGGWHAATTLLCLVAVGGVTCNRSRTGLVVASLALAAAFLGDLLSVVVAALPLLAAGALAAWRRRDRRASYRHLAAVVGGGLTAIVARLCALAAGTYTIGSRSVVATASQALRNLQSIPDRVAGFFGVTDVVASVPATPWPLRVAELVLLVGILAAFVAALGAIVVALIGPARRGEPPDAPTGEPWALAGEPWALADVLCLAVVASLAGYVVFATDSAVALARYLLPGVVFAIVLAAGALARLTPRIGRQTLRPAAVAGLVLLGCSSADFAAGSIGPASPPQATAVARFLADHHLSQGIGDYWSASIVTVESADAVRVRPVQLGPRHSLVRYEKQSSASWYSGVRFRFFVADAATPWQGVTVTAAEKAFGMPARSYAVGPYRVLVWSHPLRISS